MRIAISSTAETSPIQAIAKNGQVGMCMSKVWTTKADHILTFDLRLPTWPFFLVAWLGDASAVLLIAIRTYRLIFQPDEFGAKYQIKPVE